MLREGFNHGFAQSDWDAAKAEARQVMIECARSRRMIPYSDLVRQITRICLQAHTASGTAVPIFGKNTDPAAATASR
jgi:hypothetical protein